MATVSVVNVAGDALSQSHAFVKSANDSKTVQISITPLGDDDIGSDGKGSSESCASIEADRSRPAREAQIAQLEEEISTLKNDLERCIQEAVGSRGAAEKKRLQGKTNAAYKAWAAKELVLTDLLSAVQTPNGSTTSLSTISSGTMSIKPYPTSIMPTSPKPQHEQSPSATAFMQQIGWVKPASLIQYLNSGVEVNGMGQYPGYPQHPITPLMAIIRSPFVSESGQVIDLLLHQGADPCLRDTKGLSAFAHAIYAQRKDAIRAIVTTLHNLERHGFPTGHASLNLDTTWTGAKHLHWDAALAIINNDEPTLTALLANDPSLHYSLTHTACLPLAILFSNTPAVSHLLNYSIDPFTLFRRAPPDPSRPFTSPASMAIHSQNLPIISTILFHSVQTSERRGRLWYAQLFSSMPASYPNAEIIEFVIDNVPLVEALDRAMRIEDREWVHRIVLRTVSLLLEPDTVGNGGRATAAEAFWMLVERAYHSRACSRRRLSDAIVEVVEAKTGRDFMFVACGGSLGISLGFAEAIESASSRKSEDS